MAWGAQNTDTHQGSDSGHGALLVAEFPVAATLLLVTA